MDTNEKVVSPEMSVSKLSHKMLISKLTNNIYLTNVADNKANVLLSLNAAIMALLIPQVVRYIDFFEDNYFVYPIILFLLNSLFTIYLSILVLRPGRLSEQQHSNDDQRPNSPFYFGSTKLMTKQAYIGYFDEVAQDAEQSFRFMIQDYYEVSRRLYEKMALVRRAFNTFLVGIVITSVMTLVLLLIHLVG